MRLLLLAVGLAVVSARQVIRGQGSTGTFSNPVICGDFPDNDVSVGADGLFYYSASNMHFSPGAPILRSADLVNWELIGHSVPTLDFGEKKSNKTWYWIGCVDFNNSYVYTSSPTGKWKQSATIGKCYYDCGLLIDDDDKMYVVWGSHNISISQLSPDGLSEVKSQDVFTSPGTELMEGNRLYKKDGLYYVLNDYPQGLATYIWKSTTPWAPWTYKLLQAFTPAPVEDGITPHQGSLIKTSHGDWYFLSFTWAYPNGRMPVLAPITWGSDGYPILTLVNGSWGTTYPNPLPTVKTPSWTGSDTFRGDKLDVSWKWNHNPDKTNTV
ncbi:hypothetical protein ACEPPN_017841 [Leptodophora sp. 'Broadleaf-Isolate-01']